jgi:putative hemin transport protein
MTTTTTATDLAARWAALRDEHPRLRIRDAADRLGVSELELLLTRDEGVTRLELDFESFLPRLEALGEVMALTRNDHCVIETDGVYRDPDISPHATAIVQPGVDLRIFQRNWDHLVAVENRVKDETRRSFQIFDAAGHAVHKIWLRDGSDVAAFEAIVADLALDDPAPLEFDTPAPAAPKERTSEVDRDGLLDAWSKLEHTHDFFRLMGRFDVTRTEALEIAEGRYTRPLDRGVATPLLEVAAERGIEIMAFVGNEGCIQIFSGKVHRIVPMDEWINVMDPGFNLHLAQGGVDRAWAVTKPTAYGDIHSVELYAEDGSTIVSFFGLRKEGSDVAEGWAELVAELA